MMAMCPEAVDMTAYSGARWYVESAANATPETGERGRRLILAHMRKVLGLPPRAD
jgi:creatinine amidohydrolase/Fe(II)-dependent formamide hydrolase-like protein